MKGVRLIEGDSRWVLEYVSDSLFAFDVRVLFPIVYIERERDPRTSQYAIISYSPVISNGYNSLSTVKNLKG